MMIGSEAIRRFSIITISLQNKVYAARPGRWLLVMPYASLLHTEK